jgi:DNA-binding LacI/PurR family transcriptional regulator
MRDVALASGVDRSTVSRVFNASPSRVPIASETRERVMEAARRLGYRPNPLARGLAGARKMLIGAVMRDFSDPFFADAIEALATEASNHGYNIVVGGQGRWQEGLAIDQVLETRYCDAVIIVGDLEDQPSLLGDLRLLTVPVVALWQGVSPVEFPSVDVDNHTGTILGLEHLVGLGHERIAFISARLPGDNLQREKAYVEFMTEHFGPVPEGYVQRVPNSLSGGSSALHALLKLPVPPTAVAASTDLTAVGVLHAAYAVGGIVPKELSVVGWDDLAIAAYTVPGLTTLRMPSREIVAEGVRMAVEYSQNPGAARGPFTRYFEPTLIVRDSTAPPAAMAKDPSAVRGAMTMINDETARRAAASATHSTGPSAGEERDAVQAARRLEIRAENMPPEPQAPGSDMALRPNEVAFAIAVDPSTAVGGALAPGARVSVVAVPNALKSGAPTSGAQMSMILGTDLTILALRTPEGQAFTAVQAGSEVANPPRLGSVVLAIPEAKLAMFAAATATSTFYLALSDQGGIGTKS